MSETKLKPCPFCGSPARVFEGHNYARVECTDGRCDASGPLRRNDYRAIRAWNRRHPIDEGSESDG